MSLQRSVPCPQHIDEGDRRKQQRIIGNAVEDLQLEDEAVTHIGKIADRSAEVRLGILDDGGGKAGRLVVKIKPRAVHPRRTDEKGDQADERKLCIHAPLPADADAHDQSRDIRFGITHHGIHKDDLLILLNDRPAHLYASQGQQRSIVLALKIALLQLIYDEIKEYPILLLDDVLSELDDRRKTMLLDLLSEKIQTFITTTSLDGLSHEVIRRAYKIEIRNRKESM